MNDKLNSPSTHLSEGDENQGSEQSGPFTVTARSPNYQLQALEAQRTINRLFRGSSKTEITTEYIKALVEHDFAALEERLLAQVQDALLIEADTITIEDLKRIMLTPQRGKSLAALLYMGPVAAIQIEQLDTGEIRGTAHNNIMILDEASHIDPSFFEVQAEYYEDKPEHIEKPWVAMNQHSRGMRTKKGGRNQWAKRR